jgi:hypothetical protein
VANEVVNRPQNQLVRSNRDESTRTEQREVRILSPEESGKSTALSSPFKGNLVGCEAHFFWLNIQALEVGIVDLNLPFDGFSRASGLPFGYRLSSFWRQKEGKTARLTQLRLKRKGPFVAPAKLALHNEI